MVFLNYRGSELWTQYWHRIDPLTINKVLISKDDPKLQSELKNADALLLKTGRRQDHQRVYWHGS